MAITDPVDTLAYHNSRVLCAHRDMTHVPCAAVAKAIKKFMANDSAKDTSPDKEAVWFYGMNHGMALISAKRAPLEPLSPWEQGFVNQYHSQMAGKAIRAFYYLVLICTREARHNQSLAKDAGKIGKQFGEPIEKFLTSIKGGEAGISKAFLDTPPDVTIGAYCKALAWQFYNCKWSSGYGGKKWGMVTDCLVRFVTGEYTAEMMLDTVWTLAHNGGPIFNKNLCYAHWTPTLYRILDVQRSGQMPEAILYDVEIMKFADAALIKLIMELNKEFPRKLGKFVDWEVVEALGAVHQYPKDKELQAKKHGLSPAAKAAQQAAEAKAQAEIAAAKQKAEEHAKKWFQVMPGLEVQKVQRAA